VTAPVAMQHAAVPLVADAMANLDLHTAAGCGAAHHLEQVLAPIGIALPPLFQVPTDDAAAVAVREPNLAALRAAGALTRSGCERGRAQAGRPAPSDAGARAR
jgi:hypothetical protein